MPLRKREADDGRLCVRTIGEVLTQLPPETTIRIQFCDRPCEICGQRNCGQVINAPGWPHNENSSHICGECDVTELPPPPAQ